MDSFSSSSSTRKNTKLSVRGKPTFKKSSFSVNNNLAAKKNTNLAMREKTILKKAYELSTLCEIEACVIYYSREGELIETWPEDQSKVRDLAERFSRLSDKEKRKKSSNLSQFLNKKMNDEKKRYLEGKDDNKFPERVLEIEGSLQNNLQILQDRLRLLRNPQAHQTEPDQRNSRIDEQDLNFKVSPSGFFSNDSSSSLFNDPLMNFSNDHSRLPVLSDSRTDEQNHNFMVSSSGFCSTDPSSSSLFNDPLMNFSNDQSHAASSSHLSPALINDQSHLPGLSDCGFEQNQNFRVSSGFFSTDLSSSSVMKDDPLNNLSTSSLIDDPYQHLMSGVSSTEQVMSGFATDSLNHPQSKFSVFMYNHDNATFTQLGDSASSSFDQALTPFDNNLMSSALLGAQGFVGDGMRSCGNNNIPTLNPLLDLGQYASWNQTPSYGDPMMLSSSYTF